MKQEAIEIDMEFFSKHVGPYFTWLESKIESGWQQSDSVQKDVLKEVRYLSTNMRARFILGISVEDFAKEAGRTLDLLELASDAFPEESDEIEAKIEHFCKIIREEIGDSVLPEKYRGKKIIEVKAAEAAPAATPVPPSPQETAVAREKPKVMPPSEAKKPVPKTPPAPKVQTTKPAVKKTESNVQKTVPLKTAPLPKTAQKPATPVKPAVKKIPKQSVKPAAPKTAKHARKSDTKKTGKEPRSPWLWVIDFVRGKD